MMIMLADFVLTHKDELVRQVELRAAADEGPGLAKGRHGRITALVEELIEALRFGNASSAPPAAMGRDEALKCHERSLIRQETVSEVVGHSLAVPPGEIVIAYDWASTPTRRRLEERARRLSDLLDDVNEHAVIVTPDGRIEYLNRRAASFVNRATGVPTDQLLGKTGRELGLAEEIDFSSQPRRIQALARQRASREEQMLGRWHRTKYRAISSADGNLEAIAFVHSDIHEHKLVELRLELLSRLSAMVGSVNYEDVSNVLASVPIPEIADWCTVNILEEGHIVRTSVSHCDPSKAALRDAVMEAVPAWNENPLWTRMKLTTGFQLLADVSDELLRKLTINAEQYGFMKQMGVQSLLVQPVVSRGQIVAIFNLMYTAESGRRYGRGDPELAAEMALHAAHIIESARLLRDLRTTEARFRVSLAGAKTVVFEQDASLRYRWHYNPMGSFDPLGQTDEESFSADDAALLTSLKRRILEGGESSRQELALTVGGERRICRHVLEPVLDPTGKPVGIIGSATDITEEKRLQEQLSESLRFRDRMIGVLGHDLRNPLNAVKVAAGTLRRDGLTGAACGRVAMIERATDRMNEMIATLLDFARVRGHGGLPVTRVPTDLGALVRDLAGEFAAAFPDRPLQINVRGELQGRWDAARVEQAISNLVANAIEHGDPRAPVGLSVDGTREAVVVKVKNDGPTIPPELRPVLFEAFSRADSSPHGLGLGLFIVKEIAVAHGGTIDVESSAETGTVFTLVLPRAAEGA
jgi:PAS domain S-box-containing protein